MTTLSQDTLKQRSKEITRYLAEGLEAKEILKVRNAQLRAKDSTISILKSVDSLHRHKDSLNNVLITELESDMKECNEQYNKLGAKVKRQNTIMQVLLGLAIIEGLLIWLK